MPVRCIGMWCGMVWCEAGARLVSLAARVTCSTYIVWAVQGYAYRNAERCGSGVTGLCKA